MDIEKRYQDEREEEGNIRNSGSINEEYESLMTGIQLPRPVVGTKLKKLAQLIPTLLLLSFACNIFQLAYTVSKRPNCVSLYAKLPENEILTRYQYSTEYGTHNTDEEARDALWNAIDVSDGFVALTHKESDELGLPRSETFPWDINKGMYVIHGYHALHCLTLVYAYTFDSNLGKQPQITYHHVLHCLDLLRQDIMCHADDFLDYTAGPDEESLTGDNQPRMCRDWNRLNKWAKERTSCYKSVNISRAGEDHGVEHQLDRYTYCPEGSPYKSIIDEWKYLSQTNSGNRNKAVVEDLTEAEIKADADEVAKHNSAILSSTGE